MYQDSNVQQAIEVNAGNTTTNNKEATMQESYMTKINNVEDHSTTLRARNANDELVEVHAPSELVSKVMAEYMIRTRDNRRIPAIMLQGWTGSPDYYDYSPGYIKENGKEVQPRFTTHILVENEDGSRDAHRVNFWGGIAEAARKALLAQPRVAFLRIRNGIISTYEDRNGVMRSSINVNYENQYRVLKLKDYRPNGSNFMDHVGNDDMTNAAAAIMETDVPF